MPSYHISSSGKLVQCKNDPCKLHAGTDFQAENLKEAQKIAENATRSNNVSKSLNKDNGFSELPENVQNLAQDYYNKLLDYAKNDRLASEAGSKYGYKSDEFAKARAESRKSLDEMRNAKEILVGNSHNPNDNSVAEIKVDNSNKMPVSLKRAISGYIQAVKNDEINSTDETRIAQSEAWNKLDDASNAIIKKAIMNNNSSTTKPAHNVKLSENTQKLAQNYYNNLLNYAEGYNYENEMEAAHGLRSGEHWRARIANIKKLDALNDAREALKGLMPTYDWPIDNTRKVPESFLKAVGRFEIAANAEKADSNDKTRAARDRAWNKVRKEVQKVFSETIKEVDITPEPY